MPLAICYLLRRHAARMVLWTISYLLYLSFANYILYELNSSWDETPILWNVCGLRRSSYLLIPSHEIYTCYELLDLPTHISMSPSMCQLTLNFKPLRLSKTIKIFSHIRPIKHLQQSEHAYLRTLKIPNFNKNDHWIRTMNIEICQPTHKKHMLSICLAAYLLSILNS